MCASSGAPCGCRPYRERLAPAGGLMWAVTCVPGVGCGGGWCAPSLEPGGWRAPAQSELAHAAAGTRLLHEAGDPYTLPGMGPPRRARRSLKRAGACAARRPGPPRERRPSRVGLLCEALTRGRRRAAPGRLGPSTGGRAAGGLPRIHAVRARRRRRGPAGRRGVGRPRLRQAGARLRAAGRGPDARAGRPRLLQGQGQGTRPPRRAPRPTPAHGPSYARSPA